MLAATYVLPYRSDDVPPREFVAYVNQLATCIDVIVVDGSPERIFGFLEPRLHPGVRHISPDPQYVRLGNGKVRGVLTGLRAAQHDRVVIADDDVRYSTAALIAVLAGLETAEVVRPQNYFAPLPWHALIDTARSLINRVTGGDWPGTLAVRRSALIDHGYDGNVLFENLEMVRTVEAGGGRARCLHSVMVRRLPPATRHFWRQRIRHAYDEFARPARLVAALLVLPVVAGLLWARKPKLTSAAFVLTPVLMAELGRRREGGRKVFPWLASVVAPLWILERGLCAWLAVAVRCTRGGVRYNGRVLAVAANAPALLARRWSAHRALPEGIDEAVITE